MATRVLLITSTDGISGGDSAGHPFPDTAPLTRNILASTFDVIEENNLDKIKDQNRMAEFKAVVLHGRFPHRDESAETGFERFIHNGKGLAVIHIASSSFEGSPRWRKLIGRVWEYGPFDNFTPDHPFTSNHPPIGSFQVDILNPSQNPVTTGLQSFTIDHDERYEDLVIAPNARIHVLATATILGRIEPVAWILIPPQGGRVFHITLGHERSTYENNGFKELLSKGVAWVAGDV